MSLSKPNLTISRRGALLGLAAGLSLTACGFAPVYGPTGAATTLRNATLIEAPRDGDGFAFANRIEDRLGSAQSAQYIIRVGLTTSTNDFGVTQDQQTTRYVLRGAAEYELVSLASDMVMTKGRVTTSTAYSATGSPVATQAAERDAQNRLILSLADLTLDQIVLALAAQ